MDKHRQSKVKFADETPKPGEMVCCRCQKRFVVPLLLPCLHTLCKKCTNIEMVSSKNGKPPQCPVCGKPLTAQSDFPVNFVINNMLNAAAFDENSPLQFLCDSCESKGERVTTKCVDCHLFLCEFCSTAHQRITATKAHNLQTMEELRGQILNGRPFLRPYFCSVHSSEVRSHFCQSCEQIVCPLCVLSQHEHHAINRIKEVAETFKVNIVNLTEQAQEKRKCIDEQLALVQDEIEELENHDKKVRLTIEKYFDKLIEALRRRMNQLQNEVILHCKTKLEYLLTRKDKLQQAVQCVNNSCLFSELAVKQGNEVEIVSVGQIVMGKLASLVDDMEAEMSTNVSEPKTENLIEFVAESEKIMNDISHLGHVKEHCSSVPTKPNLCILSSAKEAQYVLTGEVNRMSLTAINEQGKRQRRGGDKVKLSFSLANSRVTPENAGFKFGCQDNQDGTYVIAYVINRPNTYWLHVSINGCPVADSPVTVTVKPRDWIASQAMLRSQDCGGFCSPYSVIADGHDRLLVADSHNHRIKILSLRGDLLKTFGSHGTLEGQFNFPYCLALNRRGNLVIVSDGRNNRVQIVTTSGKLVRTFGGFGEGVGRFNSPHGVAVDANDLIYVADSGNSRIQIFSPEGVPVGMIVAKDMACPWGVAISKAGNIVTTDYNLHRVNVFTKSGSLSFRFGSRGDCDGHFNNPAGIAVDEQGQFVVADRSNHRVQIFQANGVFVTKFGGKGEGDGLMRFPAGVAVDKKGHLYVADTFNNRIQIFSLATV